MDSSILAHKKWACKYYIVFAPKYRRQVIYGNRKFWTFSVTSNTPPFLSKYQRKYLVSINKKEF